MLQTSFTHIFQSASEDTDLLNHLFAWFFIAAGVVLIAVIGMVTYITRKYSARKRTTEPTHYHDNRKVEIVLTVVASLVVLLFLFLALQTMYRIQTPPAKGQNPDLVITGHQWWWEAYYPESGVITANEIHIPAGKRLLVKLESADVIHDWWVPALGRKMDMVPGQSNFVWVQARQAGTYEGLCSEFCGAQHAWMRVQVIAQEPIDFENWLKAQYQPARPPTDSLLQQGAKLFREKTCANCHAVKGWSEQAAIGPDLTHIAARKRLLANKEPNDLATLKNWIRNPQQLKPGAHMPNFLLTPKEVDAIANYLHSLR